MKSILQHRNTLCSQYYSIEIQYEINITGAQFKTRSREPCTSVWPEVCEGLVSERVPWTQTDVERVEGTTQEWTTCSQWQLGPGLLSFGFHDTTWLKRFQSSLSGKLFSMICCNFNFFWPTFVLKCVYIQMLCII